MSYLYDVYAHPRKGQFGVALSDGKVHLAEVSAEGALVGTREIAPEQVAPEVSRRIRSGFTKVNRAKYLEVTTSTGAALSAAFVDYQPEIGHKDVVCFTPVAMSDDLESIAGELETVLLDAGVAEFAYRQGLERIRRARGYMAVRSEPPELVLAFADWSIRNGRVLLSKSTGVPVRVPKVDPTAWGDWLKGSVKESDVRNALEKLGWSLRHALTAPQVVPAASAAEGLSEPLVLF